MEMEELALIGVTVETIGDVAEGVGGMVGENSAVVRVIKESEIEVTREVVLIGVELIKMDSELVVVVKAIQRGSAVQFSPKQLFLHSQKEP